MLIKELDAFSLKDLRTVKTVMFLMEQHNITLADFNGFVSDPEKREPQKTKQVKLLNLRSDTQQGYVGLRKRRLHCSHCKWKE